MTNSFRHYREVKDMRTILEAINLGKWKVTLDLG